LHLFPNVVVFDNKQKQMKDMAQDASPFLFNAKDEKKVLLFSRYFNSVDL